MCNCNHYNNNYDQTYAIAIIGYHHHRSLPRHRRHHHRVMPCSWRMVVGNQEGPDQEGSTNHGGDSSVAGGALILSAVVEMYGSRWCGIETSSRQRIDRTTSWRHCGTRPVMGKMRSRTCSRRHCDGQWGTEPWQQRNPSSSRTLAAVADVVYKYDVPVRISSGGRLWVRNWICW
jgi:hypothetical protein